MVVMVVTEKAPEGLNIKQLVHGSIAWLDVEGPTLAEMEYLRTTFDFHPLALDDCMSRSQMPKVDDYDNHLFLVLHFPRFEKEARLTVPTQVSVFVGGDYVVTVHRGELRPLLKLFSDCTSSDDVRTANMEHGTGYLLYCILDGLVDYCLPILNKLIDLVDNLEARVLDTGTKRLVGDLSVAKRDILAYRRIARPQIEALELLEKKEYIFLKLDPDVYFGDLADHMRRISLELEDLKEVVESLQNTHVSITTHRTNEVMRTLTIIATIMLPLTVVSGIYGMNVELPAGNSPFSFLIVLGVMAAIAGGMLVLFRLRRWF